MPPKANQLHFDAPNSRPNEDRREPVVVVDRTKLAVTSLHTCQRQPAAADVARIQVQTIARDARSNPVEGSRDSAVACRVVRLVLTNCTRLALDRLQSTQRTAISPLLTTLCEACQGRVENPRTELTPSARPDGFPLPTNETSRRIAKAPIHRVPQPKVSARHDRFRPLGRLAKGSCSHRGLWTWWL